MFSRINTVKADIVDALYGGADRTSKEISALTAMPEHTVREALAELAEKGVVRKGLPESGERRGRESSYLLTPELISVVADLSADPVALHICRLHSGNVTSVVYQAPDRCEKSSFLSGIAKNISFYTEKNFPGSDLKTLSFIYDSSCPPSVTFCPCGDGKKPKMFFWSKDELAAVISSREVMSELTLYVDLSGEQMRAFIFRPDRHYEVPLDKAAPSDGDSEKTIIKTVSALYRAFRPDVIYISDPFGGERLENGIRSALDGEFPEHGAFCSELFSHSFEKKLIIEASKLAVGLL